MKRLLREPLLHFLIGGALIYALYGLAADDPTYSPDRVVVEQRHIDSLVASYQRTWMRPPTAEELDALIQDFVDEEILVRESLGLGLDRASHAHAAGTGGLGLEWLTPDGECVHVVP